VARPHAHGPAGWIHGRVATEDGKALQSFTLNGERIESPSGTFDVPFGATGTERLVVGAPNLAFTAKLLSVRAGADADVTVVLTPGRSLRGRVVAASSHRGVVDALVDVTEKHVEGHGEVELSEEWGAVRTGPTGVFELSHVEAGVPTLVVSHEGFAQGWFPLIATQSEIVVELSEGTILTGTVKPPLPDCVEARLVREGGGVRRQALVEAGVYRLSGIPPGAYFLKLWDRSGPETHHPLWDPYSVTIPDRGTITRNVP